MGQPMRICAPTSCANTCIGSTSIYLKNCNEILSINVKVRIFTFRVAAPHIGHLYTALLTDASCRWQALNGAKVKLITGTDEHGLKIQQAAGKHNQPTIAYCNEISQKYKVRHDLLFFCCILFCFF